MGFACWCESFCYYFFVFQVIIAFISNCVQLRSLSHFNLIECLGWCVQCDLLDEPARWSLCRDWRWWSTLHILFSSYSFCPLRSACVVIAYNTAERNQWPNVNISDFFFSFFIEMRRCSGCIITSSVISLIAHLFRHPSTIALPRFYGVRDVGWPALTFMSLSLPFRHKTTIVFPLLRYTFCVTFYFARLFGACFFHSLLISPDRRAH